MSSLKLYGSTSGYVEIVPQAAAGNNSVTLPNTAGSIAVKDASGNLEVGTGVTVAAPSSNTFTVSTNGSERIRIDSSGRFGLGTSSPTFAASRNGLTLRANSSNGIEFLLQSTSATDGGITGYATAAVGNDVYHVNRLDGFFSWTTGSSGNTERMRLDSSGRLLVGTSTGPFDTTVLFSGNAGDGPTGDGRLHLSRGSTPGNGIQLGALYFSTNNGANQGASIFAMRDGGTWTAGSSHPSRLVFSTAADGASSPTERMRISSNGYLQTFSSANGYVAKVTAAAGTSTFLYAGNRSATDNADNGGTTVYYVYSNGTVQNATGTYTTISDANLKENIVDASSQWDDLKAIQIRNWNFKAETGHETHRQIGPIAQELEQVCPGLVFDTPDRDADGKETGKVTKGVNQSVLYMKAVKALQEAMVRIETLEVKVASLEGN